MPHQTFVEHVIASWHALAAEARNFEIVSAAKRLSDGSKGVIEIRALGHLATVEVWEHANCLDTTILRAGETTGVILAAGPCANQIESLERLRALRTALVADSSA
jgi:hypothetical protein